MLRYGVILLLRAFYCYCLNEVHGCTPGFDLQGGDIEGPMSSNSPEACAQMCESRTKCTAYSYHQPKPCSDHGELCELDGGCCWLKNAGDMSPGSGGLIPNNNKCSCSALVRMPAQPEPLPKVASPHARNVLYILFDDLRPELPGIYGHDDVHAPNIKALMDSGVVFRRAYCQIAVCSPSRMSFLTGRRPNTTRTMNFLDHVRQADCGFNRPDFDLKGTGYAIQKIPVGKNSGGSGQCCTLCTAEKNCTYWTYAKNLCSLFSASPSTRFVRTKGSIAGVSGSFRQWTTLPEAFKKAGWLTMGTGKVFHTEEGGIGPTPYLHGAGMPPNQDPQSWSVGLSMSHVNEVAPMDDKLHSCIVTANFSTCPVDAQWDGSLHKAKTALNDGEFEDKIIANDAITKLRLGSHVWKETGRPFFLAVGFRKPHLSFRFPAPYLKLYPELSNVKLAKHQVLDASIPAIAHQDTHHPGQAPWVPMNVDEARRFRLYYAATISWVDSQMGRVLDKLKELGLHNDTIIAMHSDHGWSLGEQGEWQKFTNFELGARVPLVIRDPSKRPGVSDSIVELVDIMPTLMDLAGVPMTLPSDEVHPLEGRSLRPMLEGHEEKKRIGLSMFPRCPNGNSPAMNASEWWKDNSCLFVDRSEYAFMGLSIRTYRWRYTEWRRWNGPSEKPDWSTEPVAVELYDHQNDSGGDFDAFENLNLAQDEAHKRTKRSLANLLKDMFKVDTTDRSWNFPIDSSIGSLLDDIVV
eukprot:TRINITY_DN15129_c0_g2_i1.p1 TRINITY_DN15129_c0_g2~~TRINITY_DN15129_c0_g2_i1.p1  ORF type:complete len:745 (+),score=46.39 TRINITY_DN15129_c0_g2_i1:63-2297(+)